MISNAMLGASVARSGLTLLCGGTAVISASGAFVLPLLPLMKPWRPKNLFNLPASRFPTLGTRSTIWQRLRGTTRFLSLHTRRLSVKNYLQNGAVSDSIKMFLENSISQSGGGQIRGIGLKI